MRNDTDTLTRRSQPTLKEVAERAGVSQMTVSRVLNSPDIVRQETRERVRAAITELNYRPNLVARSLAGGRSLFIGLTYNNPSSGYLGELLIGALKSCRSGGHHLVVEELSDGDVEEPERVAERLREGGLDGLLVAPPLSENAPLIEALRAAGIPCVLITPAETGTGARRVAIDEEAAAHAMTGQLLRLGHERIGFVSGPDTQLAPDIRMQGYERALREAGQPFCSELIVPGAFTYRSGMEATERLLALEEPPTAIFAANDDMAAGVIAAAHRAALRVPEDLSVAGFDDTEMARTIWPSLTTIRQPIADMAACAVDMLGEDGQERRAIVLDFELVERDSVAPPAS